MRAQRGGWAIALVAVILGVMPQGAIADQPDPLPSALRGQFCRINKTFFANGAINPNNDCQWCDADVDRFAWTHLGLGTACGSDTDSECDNPDTCNGSGVCQTNYEITGLACGDSEGACTNADACDGAGSCTDNGFKPATTTCGDPTDNACDNPDHCSGTDGNCVPDYEIPGAACGDTEGACTYADTCDGAGGCTDNGFKPVTTACGDDTNNECDNPDTCDGSGNCQINNEADDTACPSDDNDCTTDVCSGGVCTHSSAPFGTACGISSTSDCDLADTCDGEGSCQENFMPEGFICGDPSNTDCDNADTCDGQGICLSNLEVAGAACGDQADTECNAPDTCNGAGDCLDNYEPAGQTCGDVETACINVDTCNGAGNCTNNGFKDDTTACIGTSNDGPCDDDDNDHCSGSDGTCVDAYQPDTFVCGDADGECGFAAYCNGADGCTGGGFMDSSTSCTGVSNGGSCDDDANDHCDGNGACVDAFKSATTACTGTANSGDCDDDANDHCSGIDGTCVDAFRPATHACVLPRDANGNYTCTEVEYCTGADSTCPTPDINVFDPTIPCRYGGSGADAFCNPPEYCSGYGVCADPVVLPGAACVGGTRDGLTCFLEDTNPCPGGECVTTVCPGATLPCEKPWTCDYAGFCNSNGLLPTGSDCFGPDACVKYSCAADGECVDQGEFRAPTAVCRPADGECDVPDFCGDPDAYAACVDGGGDPEDCATNGRSNFDSYPDCGPDVSEDWDTACTYDLFGQEAPGACSSGNCGPQYCTNSIDCPDGWICGCPPGQVCPSNYCIPAPVEDGYGDVCEVKGRCDINSQNPEAVCSSDADCQTPNHQDARCHQSYCDANSTRPGLGCTSDAVCQVNGFLSGKCISDVWGDCGLIPGTTLEYVCCAGMEGDGRGGTPGLGQTGRCQECCDTSVNDACYEQSSELTCCDGKCTDVATDINNCGACNYEPSGVDCNNLISACSPGVVACDAANIGSGCVMETPCGSRIDQNGWEAASCHLPEVQRPVPGCDYCVYPSTTPGAPCVTEEDCGGSAVTLPDGTVLSKCYHDPSDACETSRSYFVTTPPECLEAPYTGCEPVCCELTSLSNEGEVCESDADCFGGTNCISSCDLSANAIGWYLSAFCFENPTCQFLGDSIESGCPDSGECGEGQSCVFERSDPAIPGTWRCRDCVGGN
jgi:hypothetical protein